MINNVLKIFINNFALIAPITLPAGGIQKSLNHNKSSNNIREITISSNTFFILFRDFMLKNY